MSAPLRILIVLPMYGGSLPIGQYCAQALRDMGHIVEVFDGPEFHATYVALYKLRIGEDRLEHLTSSFVNLLSQAIYAKAEHFSPDLVLALAQAPLSRPILRKLKNDNITTAMWFVEDHSFFTYWRTFAPYYDFFFVIQKEPFLTLLQEAGVSNVAYLPLAALPSFHRPMELTAEEKHRYSADLSFMGAGYPNRRLAFRSFVECNFKIWGTNWGGDDILAPCVQNSGQRVSPEETVCIYNAAAINLNLHSSMQTQQLVSQGDFVNPRTFELAAMGAFQLVDQRTLLPEQFVTATGAVEDSTAELAVFSSLEELEQAIDFYLRHPELRAQMATRARERVLREHTYEHRMHTMLEFIRSRKPQWPAPRQEYAWPEELTPQMQEEIGALLQRLDLPPSAAFDDVITRLRQENGVLSSLESTLLFLDEWRKQYMEK